MIYETLNQPVAFIFLFIFGFLSGLIFDFFCFFNYFFNKNKVLKQIFLAVSVILSFLIFSRINLLVNYGRFRVFAMLTFFGGLVLQRISLGKLFANLLNKCYNYLVKLTKRAIQKINEQKKKKNP